MNFLFLYWLPGRRLFHGQLNGGFILQMLYCLTTGGYQYNPVLVIFLAFVFLSDLYSLFLSSMPLFSCFKHLRDFHLWITIYVLYCLDCRYKSFQCWIFIWLLRLVPGFCLLSDICFVHFIMFLNSSNYIGFPLLRYSAIVFVPEWMTIQASLQLLWIIFNLVLLIISWSDSARNHWSLSNFLPENFRYLVLLIFIMCLVLH